jgi:Glycosyl hydrolase catalytic core
MVAFSTLLVASAMATAAFAAPTPKTKTKRATNAKKGAAYNDIDLVKLVTDASWAYNWNYAVDGTLPDGVEFVPMMWGTGDEDVWTTNVETALANGATAILGFNEPDDSGQANLTPAEAAAAYKEYITPYKDQAELVAPAVTNGAAPMGLTWLEEYLEECDGECGQTAIAIHYYAYVSDTSFEDYVAEAYALAESHGIYNVWITEFELTPATDAEQITFISEVLPWLDDQDYVERYSYFFVAEDYLVDAAGTALSDIGTAYNSDS